MVEVNLWSGLRRFTGGEQVVTVEATTIGEMLDALIAAHPGLEPFLGDGMTVAVDGEVITAQVRSIDTLSGAVSLMLDDKHECLMMREDQIAVELGGRTRFVSRSDIRYVEAQGDYARLHTAEGSHLLRAPLTTLEQQWREAGFVPIHRSLLVSLPHVEEIRTEAGRCTVIVDGQELQVSRRHTRELRDLLVRRNRPGGGS